MRGRRQGNLGKGQRRSLGLLLHRKLNLLLLDQTKLVKRGKEVTLVTLRVRMVMSRDCVSCSVYCAICSTVLLWVWF